MKSKHKDLDRIKIFEDWITGKSSKKLTRDYVVKETKWLIDQAYTLEYILAAKANIKKGPKPGKEE